ncbi:MAG TPA: cupin-like domain-containing protein [Thermoanaerobaculia bacterium]|nr:cupin-like domain-containing protein [Thermoanaerobaculia bacterium]
MTRKPIPRMQGFDRARFDGEHGGPGLPVVITDAIASWPALQSWSPRHFAMKFPDLALRPSVDLPDTEVPYRFRDVDYRRAMTMGEFVARMSTGNRCYVDQASISIFEGVESDYDFRVLDAKGEGYVAFWMGSRTRSGLHYDYLDNFFVQVYGGKKAILASPGDSRFLYLFPDNHTKSSIAPESPDLERHPKLARATLWEATLAPGDILFIPKGWWHYLASTEASISLSYWHGTPLNPIRKMLDNGPAAWARLAGEFVWYGVLRRPHVKHLFSPPPLGLMLYQLLLSKLSRARAAPQ